MSNVVTAQTTTTKYKGQRGKQMKNQETNTNKVIFDIPEQFREIIASGVKWENDLANKVKEINTKHNRVSDTITAETLMQMSSAITIRALKTNLMKSGNVMTEKMLRDAINYAKNPETANGDKGADLIQDICLYLWNYVGKSINDTTGDGQTTKDGEPITILRGAYRKLHNTIYGHKVREYKQTYIEDYENDHGEIAIPFLWDVPTYTDYITIDKIIKSLELNENQKYILNKRMQGYSLQSIADTKKVSKQAIANTLAKIGKKYISIYGEISVPTLEKILTK